MEAIDLASGRHRTLGHYARFELGAEDVVVSSGSQAGGAEARDGTPLELTFADGRRQTLTPRAAADWRLFGEGRWLLYRVLSMGPGNSEVHVYNLSARSDRTIAAGADRAWSFEDAPEVVVSAGDRLFVVPPGATKGQSPIEPARGWEVLGPDLFVKEETSGAVRVRTPARSYTVPFGWAQTHAREHRIGRRYLLLSRAEDVVLADLPAGETRLLAEGVRLSEYAAPLVAGDRIALAETSGRTILLSLSGRATPRAAGRGTPRSFSADGRWLAIEAPPPLTSVDLVSVDGLAASVPIAARGGSWAADKPILSPHGNRRLRRRSVALRREPQRWPQLASRAADRLIHRPARRRSFGGCPSRWPSNGGRLAAQPRLR